MKKHHTHGEYDYYPGSGSWKGSRDQEEFFPYQVQGSRDNIPRKYKQGCRIHSPEPHTAPPSILRSGHQASHRAAPHPAPGPHALQGYPAQRPGPCTGSCSRLKLCIIALVMLLLLVALIAIISYFVTRKTSQKGSYCDDPNFCSNHGNCITTEEGPRCECDQGYIGMDCSLDKDECSDANGGCQGSCHNNAGSYFCACPVGQTLSPDGRTCEGTETCDSDPCRRGSCVNDVTGVKAYSCICPQGYTGSRCELDEDECLNAQTCAGGTCQNFAGGYTCLCPDGSTGDTCSVSSSSCSSDFCLHGDCIPTGTGNKCLCTNGYQGQRCENDKDECADANGGCEGQCVNTDGSFRCTCTLGYTLGPDGLSCIDPDSCERQPCARGTCVDQQSTSFLCLCPPGYDGTYCDTNIDECAFGNGGCSHTCIDNFGSYVCECPQGYKLHTDSRTCTPSCDPVSCDQGFCVQTESGPKCYCEADYKGEDCSQKIDDCSPHPCGPGTCTDGIHSFTCDCPQGWIGFDCNCATEGTICASDNDCCGAYYCTRGTCQRCTADLLESCGVKEDCCTGICQSSRCCLDVGDSCFSDEDCCSGSCAVVTTNKECTSGG